MKAPFPQLRQVAALPWRQTADGLQVLLVSSRQTRRWVIPKGWAIEDLPDHGAAALEAFEEAGVEGITEPGPIGFFDYDKRRKKGQVLRIRVDVYALEVMTAHRSWPEASERERRWFTTSAAAAAVHEPELAAIIEQLGRSRA